MELITGPAALGGIILCVALFGWSLGRWQGGAPPAVRPLETAADPAGDGGKPLPRPVRAGAQTGTGDMVASLGTLHDEISAYRRAQQVLTGSAADGSEDVVAIVAAAAPARTPDARRDAGQPSVPVAPSLTRV